MLAIFLEPRDRNSLKPASGPPNPVIRAPTLKANWAPLSTVYRRPSDRTGQPLWRLQEIEARLFWIGNFDPCDGKDGSRSAFPRTQVLQSRGTQPGSTPLVRRYSCHCSARILLQEPIDRI